MMSGPIKLGWNEIAGYPSSPSVQAGEVLGLHVATPAHRFRADFYRVGWRPRLMGSAVWCGERVLPGTYDEDRQWPRFEFSVPSNWPSGVYVGVLTPQECRPQPGAVHLGGPFLDARCARLVVVVRPRSERGADILYKIPTLTYHAYNVSGGGSLYGPVPPPMGSADSGGIARVSLRRPGGGVGGPVKGMPDA